MSRSRSRRDDDDDVSSDDSDFNSGDGAGLFSSSSLRRAAAIPNTGMTRRIGIGLAILALCAVLFTSRINVWLKVVQNDASRLLAVEALTTTTTTTSSSSTSADSSSSSSSSYMSTSSSTSNSPPKSRSLYLGFDDCELLPDAEHDASTHTASTAGDVVLTDGLSCALWKRDLYLPRTPLEPLDSDYRFLLVPNSVGDLSKDLVHLNLAINVCLLFNLSLAIPTTQRANVAQFLTTSELGVTEEQARKLMAENDQADGESSAGGDSSPVYKSTVKVTLTIDSISSAASQLPRAAMIEVLLSRSGLTLAPEDEAAFARFAKDAFFSGPLMRVAHYTFVKALLWSGKMIRLSHNVLVKDENTINVAVYVLDARPDRAIDGSRGDLLQMLAKTIDLLEPIARKIQDDTYVENSNNVNGTANDAQQRPPALHVAILDRRDPQTPGGGEARILSQMRSLLKTDPSIAYLNAKLWPSVSMREMLRSDVLLAPPSSAMCYFAAVTHRSLNLLYGAKSTEQLMSLAESVHSLVVSPSGAFDTERASHLLRLQNKCRPAPPTPPPAPPADLKVENQNVAFLE